jgi:hypothetical protein
LPRSSRACQFAGTIAVASSRQLIAFRNRPRAGASEAGRGDPLPVLTLAATARPTPQLRKDGC